MSNYAEELDISQIKAITDVFAGELKNTLAEQNIRATGALSNSIKGIVNYDGKWLEISVQLEDYWRYVEKGRKAGKFPPVDEIMEWVRIKPVIPVSKGGKVPTTNQLAYLVGRKIANKGTKPHPFLTPTINEFNLIGKVENILYQEFNNIFNNELEGINEFKIESK
ncbi:MAG: hypothetical protein II304_07215 [Bacteroidales bacterium]|nr:hypothetical protein [Bacteroidales bacterium]